jgi:hypothetical protein
MDNKFEKPRGYKNLNTSEYKPQELSFYQKIKNYFSYYFYSQTDAK